MRRNPEYENEGNLTALAVDRMYQILGQIPFTMASLHPWEPSFPEQWLKDPPSAVQTLGSDLLDLYYEDLPLHIFSDRLAMVLNTYLCATFNLTYTVGSDGASLENRDSFWAKTTGSWTTFTAPVYHVNRGWFLLYFASAIVLTICAA